MLLSRVLRLRRRSARRIPVVVHLVIVPEDDLRHLGVEAPHVFVDQVVLVAAAEFVERLAPPSTSPRDDVLPDAAVIQRDLRLHRLIGVDRVAAVDEEIGCARRIVS